MALFEITKTGISSVTETTFSAEGIRERGDLQAFIRDGIDVVSPGSKVLFEEFGEWEESQRRIDLLALDPDGTIVVI